MSVIGTAKMRTDPLSQLARRKQASGFNNRSFAMHPLWLDGIEPGTFGWQSKGQNAHAVAALSDLLVVFPDPIAHDLTDMPGRIIPDQQPGTLALSGQTLTAPVEKGGGDITDRTAIDKAQPHLLALRIVRLTLLPQDPITGQGFGIRVALFPRLLFQMHGILFRLPGMHARESKAAPPDLILETNGPVRLLAGPGDQAVTRLFFADTADRGRVASQRRWQCCSFF